MTLGEKIRQVRLERGLTQKQLAGDRITRNQLSQIENDLAQPSMRTLEYLAAGLGVDAGWLMTQEDGDAAQARLTEARDLFREGRWAECMERTGTLTGEEALLMRSICARRVAEQALGDERFSEAGAYAEQALECYARCLYPEPSLQIAAAGISARCAAAEKRDTGEAFEAYRQIFLQQQTGVQYHLTMARYDLEQEHIQAAEREIWSIADLPEESRAEYLILRGRIAAKKEQYENAILYLQQAREVEGLSRLLRRELLLALERCYSETQQYKQAYECAAAQREL